MQPLEQQLPGLRAEFHSMKSNMVRASFCPHRQCEMNLFFCTYGGLTGLLPLLTPWWVIRLVQTISLNSLVLDRHLQSQSETESQSFHFTTQGL